jgi:HK97 gp10 family phage protein
MQIEFRGLNETIVKLDRTDRDVKDTSEPMRQATMLVTGAARRNAPVDRGVTRASIMPSVESRNNSTVGVVGSNQMSALFMERGTRPHWPPLAALETWARRHGTTAFLVARAISRRGTKARLFLQHALDDNRGRIVQLFNDYVKRVTK